MKLCINSRDELRMVELDDVVYLQASGNYSDFYYRTGYVRSELSCLSDFEEVITRLFPQGAMPFVRLGRSLLVNVNYVLSVNIKKQLLTFTVNTVPPMTLTRAVARELKQAVGEHYEGITPKASSDTKPL